LHMTIQSAQLYLVGELHNRYGYIVDFHMTIQSEQLCLVGELYNRYGYINDLHKTTQSAQLCSVFDQPILDGLLVYLEPFDVRLDLLQ